MDPIYHPFYDADDDFPISEGFYLHPEPVKEYEILN